MSDNKDVNVDPLTGEETAKTFADKLIDDLDSFQPDAMEDFDDRVASGEFENLSMDEIKEVYRREAIDQEIADEEQAVNDRLNAMDGD